MINTRFCVIGYTSRLINTGDKFMTCHFIKIIIRYILTINININIASYYITLHFAL